MAPTSIAGRISSPSAATAAASTPPATTSPCPPSDAEEAFVVEGSYDRRVCAARDSCDDVIAEVWRKDAVGDDAFRLVVRPHLSALLAMGQRRTIRVEWGRRHHFSGDSSHP